MYREYTRGGAQPPLVITLITGRVLLLSAAGIHALMSFTVNQRQRTIGFRSALGAPARRILTSVLARATRQLALAWVSASLRRSRWTSCSSPGLPCACSSWLLAAGGPAPAVARFIRHM